VKAPGILTMPVRSKPASASSSSTPTSLNQARCRRPPFP
jgi:hypothetical protein